MKQQRVVVGNIETFDKAVLQVVRGPLSEEQIEKVIFYAQTDAEIRKLTSDATRFKDRASFDKWLEKKRLIYTLTDSQGHLAGIAWFGARAMPDVVYIRPIDRNIYGMTFSLRMYSDWRGKRLALPFTNMAFADFIQTDYYKKSKSKGMWIEGSVENLPGMSLYKKLGFVQVSQPDEHNEIVLIPEERN